MLLGLTGLKGSGKDTVGAYLVKEHGFERRSFADKLKESAAALFDVPAWQFDEWKRDPEMRVGFAVYSPTREMYYLKDEGITVREFLQRYGTEAHRDVFGRDFWIDHVLPVGGFYAGRAIVVTDVRFRNEMERIQLVGGHVIFVDRPALDQKDPHSSETEVGYGTEIGYHLMNDSTMDELYDNIERMLEELG
jgi:hypothetical protein